MSSIADIKPESQEESTEKEKLSLNDLVELAAVNRAVLKALEETNNYHWHRAIKIILDRYFDDQDEKQLSLFK